MDGISVSVTRSSSLYHTCTNVHATCRYPNSAGVEVCANGSTEANDVCNSFSYSPYNFMNIFSGIGYGSYAVGMALNVVSTCGCLYNAPMMIS